MWGLTKGCVSRLIGSKSMSTFQPIVISGPSGSGKSTLVKRLMAEFEGCFVFSVSHTTRQPRPGEAAGIDYHYVDRPTMETKIDNKEFVEHAIFSGNMYGTSKQAIKDVQQSGRICILDVDMQGVKNIKETDLDPTYIFCKPPSLEILEQRLRGRGTESEEAVLKRLARAAADIQYGESGAYDYILINDNLEEAYSKFKDILSKELDKAKLIS